jgi:outer membrane protein TolC
MQQDTQARYKLGSSPLYATLTARQQYQNASVQYVRARAARLADTAALFDSMGNPPGGDAPGVDPPAMSRR